MAIALSAGTLTRGRVRGISLPKTSPMLMNWAAVAGFYYFVSGKKDIWFSNKFAHTHKQ